MNNQTKSKARYVKVPRTTGIRKDTKTGHFLAQVKISNNSKSKTLHTLEQAKRWQNKTLSEHTTYFNVQNNPSTFKEGWERYLIEYVPTLNLSTIESIKVCYKYFEAIHHMKMSELNPNVITQMLLDLKKLYLTKEFHKRYSFNIELKILKSFFNWYREVMDYTFINPVLKRHKQIGKIKEKEFKHKKMTPEEITSFLQALKFQSQFWFEFATMQFYFAGRVQEIAGLQVESVNLTTREIIIKDVAVWGKSKQFIELKRMPKNGEIRMVYINDQVMSIVQGRLMSATTSFMFSIDERPLKYREIQYNYNKALKSCGLYPRFSGTHFLRHSMATITRKVTNSLDLAQAVTGHRDQKIVQHYAYMDADNNRQAQMQVEDYLGVVLQNSRSEQS